METRLDRARRIAGAAHPHARASDKPRPGRPDCIAFGLPRNLPGAMVALDPDAFDALDDDAAVALLRAAWGLF